MGLLVVGGLFLGPLVQKFAFGAYWTGWPYGTDLTDNKTLIAFLAWLPATIAAVRGLRTRLAVVLGWIVMMGVFLIPHSMRGSELDWSETGAGGARLRPAQRGPRDGVISWGPWTSKSLSAEGDRTFLLVRSGGACYALPATQVRHVVRGLACHPVPGGRPHLLGLAQYAGEPLADSRSPRDRRGQRRSRTIGRR